MCVVILVILQHILRNVINIVYEKLDKKKYIVYEKDIMSRFAHFS